MDLLSVGSSLGSQLLGGVMAGGAAKSAAEASAAKSREWLDFTKQQQNQALDGLHSPAQLAAYDRNLASAEGNVRRMEKLSESLNPALIEAGKQAYDVLQGKEAPGLAPIREQRARQRQSVLDNLRAQLGPGAETSSIGINALNKFDAETNTMQASTQQNYLNTVLSTSLSARPDLVGATGATNQMALNGPGAQRAGIIGQFTGLAGQAYQSGVNTAGAGSLGDLYSGMGIMNMGKNLLSAFGADKGGGTAGTQEASPNTGISGAPMSFGADYGNFSFNQMPMRSGGSRASAGGGGGGSNNLPPSYLARPPTSLQQQAPTGNNLSDSLNFGG